MKYYLKENADGFEFSPAGRKVDEEKLKAGFTIVHEIPDRIKNIMPGGRDYVPPKTAIEEIEEIKTRLSALESRNVR